MNLQVPPLQDSAEGVWGVESADCTVQPSNATAQSTSGTPEVTVLWPHVPYPAQSLCMSYSLCHDAVPCFSQGANYTWAQQCLLT